MVLDLIYSLIITPIEMVLEILYSMINAVFHFPLLAIIGLSIAVNIIILPLYKKSDAMQEEERERQKQMKPWLDHIKKAFKGDERYYMQRTYYSQVHYKPIYALRGSLSLLLQIPFFIAAFHFISHLNLPASRLLFIEDITRPDGALVIGQLKINIMPIIMTAINIISGTIYSKGLGAKDKIQIYGIALIFLVILYNSPAILVIYWTCNNLFSLVKNIIMKAVPKREKKKREYKPIDKKVFFLSAVYLTILLGLVIPISVISSSPTEFISSSYGPGYLIARTFLVYLGFCVLWLGTYYLLVGNLGKNILATLVFVAVGIFTVNYLFFRTGYGNMSANLVYEASIYYKGRTILIDFVVMVVIAAILIFLATKKTKIAVGFCSAMIIGGLAFSGWNFIKVETELAKHRQSQTEKGMSEIIPLSKTGKNVIVFMLDRAISGYVPRMLEEKPELKDSFDGFTYYPNTVAYGGHTNFSTPSLFGGYDYTPAKINKRSEESLQSKQDEALQVLPSLFNDENFEVTVCDPPYAGTYTDSIDLSIYDKYENVTGHVTIGAYNTRGDAELIESYEKQQKFNFVSYSAFRSLPMLIGEVYYDGGKYCSADVTAKMSQSFFDSYSVLTNLINITKTTEEENTFLMMQNATTHSPVCLSVPDYKPTLDLTGARDLYDSDYHYMVDMASFLELGKWFDYMKAEGVWDNTKIILCSDHGYSLGDFDYMKMGFLDVEMYNALLMVKDFGATGITTDETFMTLADIPALATEGSINSPVNPFTGNAINFDGKADGAIITTSESFDTRDYHGNILDIDNACWYKIYDNIFDREKWSRISESEALK